MSIVKRFARYTAIVAASILFLVLAWRVREPLLLFVLSLALAAAFRPSIDWLVRRGWPRGVALGVTYLTALVVIGGLAYLIGIPLTHDLGSASDAFAKSYERVLERWPNSDNQFQLAVAAQLPPSALLYRMLAGEQGAAMVHGLMGFASNAAGVLSNLSMALVLSIYWSVDQVRFERLWLSLLPVTQRTQARLAWHDIEARVGAYIRAEVFVIVLATTLLWLGFRVLQVPYPALLALFAALARLAPWLGIPTALIPPLLLGAISSPVLGPVAAGYTLIVLVGLEFGIKRRFFPQQEYSSLVIGLTVIAMGYTLGLGGIILAPLVAITIQLVGAHLLQAWAELSATPKPQVAAAPLAERLNAVRAQLTQGAEAPRPEIQSLLDRLDSLVAASKEHVERS